MQIPHDEQEYISVSAYPFLEDEDFIPEFLKRISNISVGICIYLENGRKSMKSPKATEYAHQVISIRVILPVKDDINVLTNFVRKPPPQISTV